MFYRKIMTTGRDDLPDVLKSMADYYSPDGVLDTIFNTFMVKGMIFSVG
jgi:hypothetical protein